MRVCAVLKGYLALNWHFSKKSNKRNVSQCFFDKVEILLKWAV